MEAIRTLETQLAGLPALRDVCTRIDQRLARLEAGLQRIEETRIRELLPRVDRRLEQAVAAVPSPEVVLGPEKAHVDPQPQTRTTPGEPADAGVLARAGLLLRRVTAASSTSVGVRDSKWKPLAVAAVVLVAAVGLASLIQTVLGGTPNEPEATETRQTDRASSSAVEDIQSAAPVDATVPALSTARPVTRLVELTADAPSVPKASVVAPRSQPSSPEPGPITSTPRVFVGTLSITSVPPGATVSINGERAGVTPLKLSGYRAGSSAILISQEGFERWSASVRVPAGRVTEVNARLRPLAAP